jgi:hypothetical protein
VMYRGLVLGPAPRLRLHRTRETGSDVIDLDLVFRFLEMRYSTVMLNNISFAESLGVRHLPSLSMRMTSWWHSAPSAAPIHLLVSPRNTSHVKRSFT